MGVVVEWPSVPEPGRPYRKLVDLSSGRPSLWCGAHRVRTDARGVCFSCLSEWRREVWGADPDSWAVCEVCEFPLHPVVEAEGWSTCPSCDINPRSVWATRQSENNYREGQEYGEQSINHG